MIIIFPWFSPLKTGCLWRPLKGAGKSHENPWRFRWIGQDRLPQAENLSADQDHGQGPASDADSMVFEPCRFRRSIDMLAIPWIFQFGAFHHENVHGQIVSNHLWSFEPINHHMIVSSTPFPKWSWNHRSSIVPRRGSKRRAPPGLSGVQLTVARNGDAGCAQNVFGIWGKRSITDELMRRSGSFFKKIGDPQNSSMFFFVFLGKPHQLIMCVFFK